MRNLRLQYTVSHESLTKRLIKNPTRPELPVSILASDVFGRDSSTDRIVVIHGYYVYALSWARNSSHRRRSYLARTPCLQGSFLRGVRRGGAATFRRWTGPWAVEGPSPHNGADSGACTDPPSAHGTIGG